jgi:hypothetical protein
VLAPTTIVTRANPNTDFTTIRTFAVVDQDDYPSNLPHDLPSNTEQDVFAANRVARASLIEQGLLEVDPDFETPDVWLFSMAATKTETGYVWECVPGYGWWGWSGGWDYCAWAGQVPITYEVGTVIIGLAETSNDAPGAIVFAGAIQGVFNCDDPLQRLVAGVEKIFAQYPG